MSFSSSCNTLTCWCRVVGLGVFVWLCCFPMPTSSASLLLSSSSVVLHPLLDSSSDSSSSSRSTMATIASPNNQSIIFLTTPKTNDRRLAFGDYAETPETCPGLTSCQPICVATVADCPTFCNDGYNLCNDGTCSETICNPDLESPCVADGCEAIPIACPQVIQYLEDCQNNFSEQYDALAACNEAYEEALPLVSFTSFWFLLCYYWISIVTALVIGWCYYNQTIAPVTNQSVQILHNLVVDDDSTTTSKQTTKKKATNEEEEDGGAGSTNNTTTNTQVWTITGYKTNWIGWFINALVWITLWGIQFLLFFLTICYYIQQGAITRWPIVFYDEVQVLAAFEMVWFIGLLWSLAFQWPTSISSLFYRRCALSEATHVAVHAPIQKVELATATHRSFSYGHYFSSILWYPFDTFLRIVFAHPFRIQPNYETIYCTVDRSTTDPSIPSFYCRMRRYVYNETSHCFVSGSMSIGTTIGDFRSQSNGITDSIAIQKYTLVGPNTIPLPKPSLVTAIVNEFSKTFYVYQNFMVWTWYPYWFYYMALVNTFIRVSGGIVVAWFQYQSDTMLYQLSIVEGTVDVLRNNDNKKKTTISVKDVVPGDVVVLQSGPIHCDMVVLKSKHLIVDENAVTGESTPILKQELDPSMNTILYHSVRHKVHTIFAGTEIMECSTDDRTTTNQQEEEEEEEYTELGLVIATGSYTVKGKLLSDILSYERHQFLFDDEIKIVLFILFIQATILITLVFKWLEDQFVYAFFYGVFILGTVLPPLLPTVFVVSVGISADRLHKDNITCINPDNLLVAGKVNVCCFDKTGTLTEPSMECMGVDCVDDAKEEWIQVGMAVCHGLKGIGEDGKELIGNHVDKALFYHSGASMQSCNNNTKTSSKSQKYVTIVVNNKRYTILKQWEFDNHRQTQCVLVVCQEDGSKHVFVKGSPESIQRTCLSETIPSTFHETLLNGSKSGLYQLAMAHKVYNNSENENEEEEEDDSIVVRTRDEMETNCTFCGFINFHNPLKQETIGLIQELQAGNLLLTMITGDNVMTGICVAQESGMIVQRSNDNTNNKSTTHEKTTIVLGQVSMNASSAPIVEWMDSETNTIVDKPQPSTTTGTKLELAMTGDAWMTLLTHDRDYALSIVKYVRVFGRCNPQHKVSVVTALVQLGYITLMCGDGQNDCGALKTAHVGVALSSSTASVVAPFSSIDKKVSSVTRILQEGRCALSSAFKAYSFYIVYGQVETLLQTINAYLFITFAEWCWLFLDGIYSSFMAFTIPLAHAATMLTPRRPTASLLGPRTMYSVCGMLAINYLFVFLGLIALNQQEWYPCRKWNSEDVSSVNTIGDNYESSVLYIVGAYQYIASAIALNFGYTFRAPWYTNTIFLFFAIAFTVMHFTMTLYPSSFSCLWRVNCDNSNAVVAIVGREGPKPINNPYNTTVMPLDFRIILVAMMVSNLICLCAWEYLFVNTYLYKRYKFGNDDPLAEGATDPGSYPSGSLKKVDQTSNSTKSEN